MQTKLIIAENLFREGAGIHGSCPFPAAAEKGLEPESGAGNRT